MKGVFFLADLVTQLTSLMGVLKTALAGIAGLWVVAVPAAFFVLGTAVSFLFGLMGRNKRRKK